MTPRLKATWGRDFATIAVEVDGRECVVPGLHASFFIAGLNYSGERGSWSELSL